MVQTTVREVVEQIVESFLERDRIGTISYSIIVGENVYIGDIEKAKITGDKLDFVSNFYQGFPIDEEMIAVFQKINLLSKEDVSESFSWIEELTKDLNYTGPQLIVCDVVNFDFSNPSFVCKGDLTSLNKMLEVVKEIESMSVEDLCDAVKYFSRKEELINSKYCTELNLITESLVKNMGVFYILNK